MTDLLPLEEAWRRLLIDVKALPSERLAIDGASGRYLASPLAALHSRPAADVSAMDGYAVSRDGPWSLVGESRAGSPHSGALSSGEAVHVSTGAVVPPGADRILISENARLHENCLSAIDPPVPGRYVRAEASDFRAGEVLLERGARLNPAMIALAIAGGHARAEVCRKPRLAIIDTGDELSNERAGSSPAAIPASNAAMLAALARRFPCKISRADPVPDDLTALSRALDKFSGCDLLVTSGGASVGNHDLVRRALEAAGAEIAFHRIALKPGKPLLVARRGSQIVLALPGNPVSSYVTGFLFMLPLVRALLGAADPLPTPVFMQTTVALPPVGSRREFLRGVLDEGGVHPLARQDSGAMRALADAQLLIERVEGSDAVRPGTNVPVYLLENTGIA